MLSVYVIFGARPLEDPSLATVFELVRGIDTGTLAGDEVTLEPRAAWERTREGWFRPAPGKECGLSLMYYYPDDGVPAWVVCYRDPSGNSAYASFSSVGDVCVEGMLCGAPTRVLESCLLSCEQALSLAEQFCLAQQRPPTPSWVSCSNALS
jgi:hypothetical protein